MEPHLPTEEENDSDCSPESLPISNICKVMRESLGDKLKISKQAKHMMETCLTEFICIITSEASQKCMNEKRKTLNAEDVITVMHDLGFDNYVYILKAYLHKYKYALEMTNSKANYQLNAQAHDSSIQPGLRSSRMLRNELARKTQ